MSFQTLSTTSSFTFVRSFTTRFATNVLALAVGVVFVSGASAFAQEQTVATTQPAAVGNKVATSVSADAPESFVSASALVSNDIQFTPARVDVNAIRKNVQYPDGALKNKITGKFDLIVYIGSNGEVSTVNFVTERPDDSSMNAIIVSACDAVRKSHFAPATLNNKAISSAVRIPFNFTL
jgi:TonB family protein